MGTDLKFTDLSGKRKKRVEILSNSNEKLFIIISQ